MPNQSSNSGLLLIVSGPSGAGKTTIAREIEKQLNAVFSVSMITRPQSHKETDGVDYYFVNREEFKKQLDAGNMLEHAEVFDNYYGTPRKPVEDALAQGRLVILEIDVEGAIQVKEKMPHAFSIFILPPSDEELIARLRNRARDAEDVIQKRFAKAKDEIERAKDCNIYDHFIVNDDLQTTISEAVNIVKAKCTEQGG